MQLFWLILAIVMLVVEFETVVLISIWFVGGALAAMVAAMLGAQTWLQTVIFVGVSLLLMLLARPILKRHFIGKVTKTNVDAMTGKKGVVLEAIDNIAGTGRVKIAGMDWAARSKEGRRIEKDTVVTVAEVSGAKVIVVEPPQL